MNGTNYVQAGNIFEGRVHAGVVQDKITPGRYRAASDQPLNAGGVAFQRQTETTPALQHVTDENPPAFERPKHHGSQTRQLIPVTGCIPPHIAEQLERMRDQGGKEKLSRSAVIADILCKGVQRHVDMQYGATLEPIIERTIERKIDSATNRTANLALEAFYAAEEGRITTIYTLRFLLGSDIDLLSEIINEARGQARQSLKRYAYADERGEEAPNHQWQS